MTKDTAQSGLDTGQNQEAPQKESLWIEEPIPYKAVFKVKGGPDYLAGKMLDLSQLEQLRSEPPDGMLALERRARQDQETAEKLMQSQCYYDGEARIDIDDATSPVTVTITLQPGPRFTVGLAEVIYEPEPVIPEAFLHRSRKTGFWGLESESLPAPEFPTRIPGIEIGKPVEASAMLDAVEKIPAELVNRGYPLAKITSSLYTLDKPERKLNARITVDAGPPAYMGQVKIVGSGNVNPAYLEKLVPWQPDQEPWDNALLNDYANTLRSTGLFRSVEAHPDLGHIDKSRQISSLPIQVDVMDGPQRTVSFSARYETDTGFGVEGKWEHRNLFHNGERLSLEAPLSQQQSGIKAHFEKPAFFARQQRLLADLDALWENTESYQQEIIKGRLGLERMLARQWWGELSLHAAGGYLKDNEHDMQPYSVISPHGELRYDGRNSRINTSSGTLVELKLKPFSGYYEEQFKAFAGSVSAAAWYAPFGRKPDGGINDKLVLAGRAEAGAMPWSSELYTIPSSLRYYVGGASTVRGYAYQSIGPRDNEDDPLGGRSYQVVNLEARYMVTDSIGVVPFLDGGMVYKDEFPLLANGDMDWGLGLGLRYYTPVGPIRLDVATPLNPVEGDPPVQFYISIGQSF